MTSYAIRFEDDGREEILCPEADRRKCETPEEVARVRARHKKISKMEGCFCLDCYRFSEEKLQVRLAAGPKVSFYYAHLPGADKDKHTKAERSHGGLTAAHKAGVAHVWQRLRMLDPTAYLEEDVVSQSDDVNRRPDIVETKQIGAKHAHEIQYSAIDVDLLKMRTEDLFKFGYSTVSWYLFQTAYNPPENRLYLGNRENAAFYWMETRKNPEDDYYPLIHLSDGKLPEDKTDPKTKDTPCRRGMAKAELEMAAAVAAVAAVTPPRPIGKAAILDSLPDRTRTPTPSPFSPVQAAAVSSTPAPSVPNPKAPIARAMTEMVGRYYKDKVRPNTVQVVALVDAHPGLVEIADVGTDWPVFTRYARDLEAS